MSGIFGTFNRNSNPVDKEIINTMLDAMSYWDPDERDTWVDGPVALGHTMLWNTPESKYEHLPLEKDAYILTMDARIDNRDELFKELELPDRPCEEIGDSEFILAAYRKWGEECSKHLLGDFTFAIFDNEKQKIFCTRDHIGIKPFYYYIDDEIFVFTNDMKCFAKHPDIDNTLNTEIIARYLRGEEYRHHHTFIKNIVKLPPATSLIVTSKEIRKNQYWFPENTSPIRLGSTEAYIKKLSELLKQAVDARLRSIYPIASHLSGGLDSSGISTIASRLLRQKNKNLIAFNWVPRPNNDDDPKNFEWGYSKLLAQIENIEHHYIDINETSLAKIFMDLDITTNDTVDLWYEFILRSTVQKRGSRVILSGWGGDELVSSYGVGYVQELFLSGRFFQAIKKLKEILKSRKYSWLGVSRLCTRICIWKVLPKKVRCIFKKSNCYKSLMVCCVKKDFLHYINNLSPLDNNFLETSVRNVQLSYLRQGHIQERTESWDVSAKKDRIEYRYPLLDKRLVEFILNIPSKLFISDDTDRFIYREAMKGILPEIIRLNDEKDEPRRIKIFHEMTIKSLLYAVENVELTKNNYIDQQSLIQRIKDTDLSEYRTRNDTISVLESLRRAFFVMNIK